MNDSGEIIVENYYGLNDEDDTDTNAWEQPIERSWENVQEDAKGNIMSLEIVNQRARKRKLDEVDETSDVIEKGMIRYLYIIIDHSSAMEVTDMKPSRRLVTLNALDIFVSEYFDQNPISQLGYIISYEKVAEKVAELTGNAGHLSIEIRSKEHSVGGEMSLQNSLNIALSSLSQIPSYGTREVLIIMGSLGTCDPGDIHQTINQLKKHNVRCSVIGLAAELYICRQIADRTGGSYGIALDRSHFQTLLREHVAPPPIDQKQKLARKWIRMGFPHKQADTYPSLCACHKQFKYGGYFCPHCQTKFCELPIECNICQLTLVSSPHLARSYHHLHPVPQYSEPISDISMTDIDGESSSASSSSSSSSSASSLASKKSKRKSGSKKKLADKKKNSWSVSCFSCRLPLKSDTAIRLQCAECKQQFCIECDAYIHGSLHNCPGCLCL